MRNISALSRRRAALILVCAAAALGVILLSGAMGRRSSGGIPGGTNEQRLAYIRSLGWEAGTETQEEKEVLLPGEFPEVLENYNRLQQEAGFDLKPYAGKRLGMYVYRLEDPPGGAEALCTLYVCRGRIVGGDIHSTAFRGWMRPLLPRDRENKNG